MQKNIDKIIFVNKNWKGYKKQIKS